MYIQRDLTKTYQTAVKQFEASDIDLLVCNVDKKINLPGNNIAMPWFLFSEWLSKLIGAQLK